jgi:hypothetical protein
MSIRLYPPERTTLRLLSRRDNGSVAGGRASPRATPPERPPQGGRIPKETSAKVRVNDPEGIKARSRWLSESASDTTGILKKSVCIPEGCQRDAAPAGVGSLGGNEPVVSAWRPQPPATGWQASGLLRRLSQRSPKGCEEQFIFRNPHKSSRPAARMHDIQIRLC